MCPNYRKSHCCVLLVNLYVVNKVAAARGARHSVELQYVLSWVGSHKSDLPFCKRPEFCFHLSRSKKEYPGNRFCFVHTRIKSLPFADDARFKDGLRPSLRIIFRGIMEIFALGYQLEGLRASSCHE